METKKIIFSPLLFLSIVLLKPAFGHPQDHVPEFKGHYLPTLIDSSTWYIVYSFEGISTYIFKTGDNIVVDSMQYMELLTGDAIMGVICYLREDTAEKKIYMLTKDKKEEHLLYDFSLSENDTISIYGMKEFPINLDFIQVGPLTVEKTDSVETLDGIKRKRIKLSRILATENVWIEGIGCIGNFLSPGGGISMSESGELTCFYINSLKIYYSDFAQSWGNGDCVIIDDIEALDGNILSLYPNPFKNEINIEFVTTGSFKVTVANMLGQILYVNNFQHTNNLQLDLSHLEKGLYQVVISNGRDVYRHGVVKSGE